MRDRPVEAHADAKQYAAKIQRPARIPGHPLVPEQAAAIHAQASAAELEAEP